MTLPPQTKNNKLQTGNQELQLFSTFYVLSSNQFSNACLGLADENQTPKAFELQMLFNPHIQAQVQHTTG